MLLVLFASSQFMVGMHICQGYVQEIALFKEAQACEHKAQLPPCHKQESPDNSGDCCDDENIIHESSGFTASVHQITLELPFTDFEVNHAVILTSAEVQALQAVSFADEHPPNGIRPDIILLVQSFLI